MNKALLMSSTKVWDETITTLVAAGMIPSVIDRILLAGLSRAGKSTIAGLLFANVQYATFGDGMLPEELLGQYDSPQPGMFVWRDGPVARAMRNGWPLVLNEIDFAFKRGSGLQGIIHAATDVPAAITLPNGERLEAKEGYFVIATMNAMPDVLPVPVYERFQLILRVDSLSQGLQRELGEFAGMANQVASRNQQVQWQRPMSVGLAVTAAKLRKQGLSHEEITFALGFNERERNDFLTAIASNKSE
jgi:hypothetical protein